MIVTALERNARRRSRLDVYVDGIVACDISRATATKRGLRVGGDIGEGGIDALVIEDRRREAQEAAAALLARRPRSEREIRRRLAQRNLSPDIIDETVQRLAAAKLIDDAEYARGYVDIRDRTSPRSTRLLVQELRAAGVAQEEAESAVSEISDADAAYRLVQARIRSLRGADEAVFRSRLSGMLQRRGFGWSEIRVAVDRCWNEIEQEDS